MANTDLYAVLGVSRDAPQDEIKKAYRQLAKKFHPDRNPGDKAAEDKFKEVNAAFAVLGDEKKRKTYDEFGIDGLREGFDPEAARNWQRWASRGGSAGGGRPGGVRFEFGGGGPGGGGFDFGGFGDLEELLGGLFGGGRRAGGQRAHKGRDVERNVTLSVRDALNGAELHLSDGTKVNVPAGVADGQKVRVRGKGTEGPAGSGDLLLKVHVAPPPGFQRDGDDLTLDLPLTVRQALAGDTVPVPTPEGTTLQLKVPARTTSGQRLRLRGKGMPVKGGGRGDLYARVMVQIPQTSDPRAIELAEELDKLY
jgi:curved DNA-binding protein